MSSTSNINPKPCNYGCNTRIYWDVNQNAYFEVFSQKRHICPNIPNNNKKPIIPTTASTTTSNTKPTYYSKKPWNRQQPKPKMSNSFEYLQGSITRFCLILLRSMVVRFMAHKGRDPKTGLIDLLVYYEVLLGQREEVKRKFYNMVLFFTSSNSRNNNTPIKNI
jgi:hypothetical protein